MSLIQNMVIIMHGNDFCFCEEKIANRDEDYAGDDQCGAIDHIFDTILDPSKKERTNEKQQAQRVDDSRSIWLSVRKTFFKQ